MQALDALAHRKNVSSASVLPPASSSEPARPLRRRANGKPLRVERSIGPSRAPEGASEIATPHSEMHHRTKSRIAANVAVDFSLSSDEMAALDALDLGGMKGRLCWRRDELRDLDFE